MNEYTLVKEADYFHEITAKVAASKRGDTLQLISMNFVPTEPPIRALMDQLIAAAKRGASTELIVDAHDFMLTPDLIPLGPLYWGRNIGTTKHPRQFHEKTKALEALRHAGGHYVITNQPTSWPTVPIAGRSHIKAVVINETAYVGGCNLGHTGQIDYMVRLHNKATVAWIRQLISDIADRKSARVALNDQDQQLRLDDSTSLLVDAGVPGQSLILEHALQLIDQAQQWIILTCQLLPNSVTAQHLERARKRGVTVYSMYNDPSRHSGFVSLAQFFIRQSAQLRHGKQAVAGQLPKQHQRVHAKLLITEQAAMIGSHNYLRLGVRLGTAEIAFLRCNPNFARSVVTSLVSQLTVDKTYPLPKIS